MKIFKNMARFLIFILNKKRLELRFSLIVIGKNTRIDLKTRINIHSNKLIIGDNVYLRSNSRGYHAGMPFPTTILLDNENSFCEIGNNCRINGCYIHAKNKITIGENTVIASGTNIIDSNGHVTYSENRTIGRDIPLPIDIGTNVWIGLNCTILKGTKIGNNSVVGASSVVKGVFPDNSVIQGNPAKIIKTLGLNK